MPVTRAFLSLAASLPIALGGCSADPVAEIVPAGDLYPPGLEAAGPTGSRDIELRFDELVEPVAESLGIEPGLPFQARSAGLTVGLSLGEAMEPGLDYRLAGEVEDRSGNRTRFLVEFTGWNARPAELRLSEIQTAKNSSKTKPRRDFVELLCEKAGNIGGLELEWASAVKSARYRFPGCEAARGDYIVVHLAPEGIEGEMDETGASLSLSAGIDAGPKARDLWCGLQPLPDESGLVVLRQRPGGEAIDGLLYSPAEKTGALGQGELGTLAAEMVLTGCWTASGEIPSWEDSFRWKPSSARSICRADGGATGALAWYLTDAGMQSPGERNLPPSPEAAKGIKKPARKRSG
ncbi:MAG: hypothetical protein Q8M76_09110 [Spirochaetaceae bacterium]|nr:hypothetical protein [Spirochaetaceae bacterium]